MSFVGMLEKERTEAGKFYGIVIGIVTNNKDVKKLGRVKVKIPRISGESESNWARVVSFMAGANRGGVFLPEVDDEVIVAFECGDINLPYVIGAVWNGADAPPYDNGDGENNIRVIKSRSGHVIRLDDTDGKEKIEIIDKSQKNVLTIDTKENKIVIGSDKDIELLAKNGKVLIDAKQVEIKSSDTTKIAAGADIDIEASGNVNEKGSTINLN